MVNFQDGQLVKGAYVVINGVEYPVHMPQYSGTTPISSENLNKIQQDLEDKITEEVEKVRATVLYENATGATGTIQLSDNVENYEYLEIHYVSDDFHNSITVRNPKGKNICLSNNYYADNKQCMYMSCYQVLLTSLFYIESRNNFINGVDVVGNYGNTQYIRVTAVIGKNIEKEA